ncbi:hypothetical protein ColKHC_09739 [Colletotrichum higginsianum]|nr:hypothetical protein ColKHC_09739 [Colletotrichum higginsianum]
MTGWKVTGCKKAECTRTIYQRRTSKKRELRKGEPKTTDCKMSICRMRIFQANRFKTRECRMSGSKTTPLPRCQKSECKMATECKAIHLPQPRHRILARIITPDHGTTLTKTSLSRRLHRSHNLPTPQV